MRYNYHQHLKLLKLDKNRQLKDDQLKEFMFYESTQSNKVKWKNRDKYEILLLRFLSGDWTSDKVIREFVSFWRLHRDLRID